MCTAKKYVFRCRCEKTTCPQRIAKDKMAGHFLEAERWYNSTMPCAEFLASADLSDFINPDKNGARIMFDSMGGEQGEAYTTVITKLNCPKGLKYEQQVIFRAQLCVDCQQTCRGQT